MKSKLGKMFVDFKKGWFVLVILILIAPLSSAMSAEAKLKTMTRNLYLGADIFRVAQAAQDDPATVPFVVADVFQTVLDTNFAERAEAIADEIASAKPQVIGLQEVSTFYIQTPGDFIFGNPNEADDLVIDFYAVLDSALKDRGMYYDAFAVTNADVELPMIDPNSPTYFSDVRMVDHDVILVRKGHPAVEVLANNYSLNLEMNLGGVNVAFTRGFIIVDVVIKDQSFRFVNTHLELNSLPDSVYRFVQSMQMQELLGYIEGLADSKPIIMVGDFNSSPDDVPGVYTHPLIGPLQYFPPYMQAVDAGYLDTWLLQSKYDEGYTDHFDETVSDPDAELTSRIDFVFLDPSDLTVDEVNCYLVGNEMADM
ncbi:MAG: endonuclease/exonuclease/phosphatase family protein, partial [Anaerolineales bacterium]